MTVYPPRALQRIEASRLIGACPPGWVGIRDKALLTVYYRAGLRCAEALGLELRDLRRDENDQVVIRVAKPKGWARKDARRRTKPREISLDVKASGIMDDWLRVRAASSGLVFVTRTGQPIQPSGVRTMLHRAAKRAGLEDRVHVHGLRHTFARQLYEETRDPLEVMLALGHSSLQTTTRYLVDIGAVSAVTSTARREW
jgi:integrase